MPLEAKKEQREYWNKLDWTTKLAQEARLPPRLFKKIEECKITRLPAIDLPVFIYGPVGTGKTLTAIFNMMDICKKDFITKINPEQYIQNNFVRFITADEFVKKVQHEITHTPEYPIHDVVDQCQYLVLDDIGREHHSGYAISLLESLLNHRYNHDLTTVVTSNFNLEELKRKGYERSVSQLRETNKIIEMNKNLRNRK